MTICETMSHPHQVFEIYIIGVQHHCQLKIISSLTSRLSVSEHFTVLQKFWIQFFLISRSFLLFFFSTFSGARKALKIVNLVSSLGFYQSRFLYGKLLFDTVSCLFSLFFNKCPKANVSFSHQTVFRDIMKSNIEFILFLLRNFPISLVLLFIFLCFRIHNVICWMLLEDISNSMNKEQC